MRITPAQTAPAQRQAKKKSAPSLPNSSEPALIPTKPAPKANIELESFEQAVALFEQHREALKHAYLVHDCYLVSFAAGEIALRLSPSLPRDFAAQVAACLTDWTGRHWKITLSSETGSPSLHEQKLAAKEKEMQYAQAHPLVGSVLEQFPGAKLISVH